MPENTCNYNSIHGLYGLEILFSTTLLLTFQPLTVQFPLTAHFPRLHGHGTSLREILSVEAT